MCLLPDHWRKSEAVTRSHLPLEADEEHACDWQTHILPTDPLSQGKRKRDLMIVGSALAAITVIAIILGARYGAPHQWHSFANFAKSHPMALAAPITATAIIAAAILVGKISKKKEIVTLIALSALLGLSLAVLHIHAPAAFKYIQAHPQLIAAPLVGYSIVRLTHHLLKQKEAKLAHPETKLREQIETTIQKANDISIVTDKELSNPLQARNMLQDLKKKSASELDSYRIKAGLIATAGLIALIGISLLGCPHVYPSIGNFFKHNWQKILTAAVPTVGLIGVTSAAVWAFNRGERATEDANAYSLEGTTQKTQRVFQANQYDKNRQMEEERYKRVVDCLIEPAVRWSPPTEEDVRNAAKKDLSSVKLLQLIAEKLGKRSDAALFKQIHDGVSDEELAEQIIAKQGDIWDLLNGSEMVRITHELYKTIQDLISIQEPSDFDILQIAAKKAGMESHVNLYRTHQKSLNQEIRSGVAAEKMAAILNEGFEDMSDDDLNDIALNKPEKIEQLISIASEGRCTVALKRLKDAQIVAKSLKDLYALIEKRVRAERALDQIAEELGQRLDTISDGELKKIIIKDHRKLNSLLTIAKLGRNREVLQRLLTVSAEAKFDAMDKETVLQHLADRALEGDQAYFEIYRVIATKGQIDSLFWERQKLIAQGKLTRPMDMGELARSDLRATLDPDNFYWILSQIAPEGCESITPQSFEGLSTREKYVLVIAARKAGLEGVAEELWRLLSIK